MTGTRKLLLDTHIAVWLDHGDPQLQNSTRLHLEAVWNGGGILYFSAVSAWEIAMLVQRGRLHLDVPALDWVSRFLALPGVHELPLASHAAAACYDFHPFASRDPADHLLVATAIEHGCTLVTYDRAILEFGRRYGGQYRFQVAD